MNETAGPKQFDCPRVKICPFKSCDKRALPVEGRHKILRAICQSDCCACGSIIIIFSWFRLGHSVEPKSIANFQTSLMSSGWKFSVTYLERTWGK